MKIPFGETISYGELARRIGNPAASRAVGRANATNPIALIVPCHRVIGTNGKLTGYAGGLELKEKLLAWERVMAGEPAAAARIGYPWLARMRLDSDTLGRLEASMKYFLVAFLLMGSAAFAQDAVPEIAFDSVPNRP